MSWRSLPFKEKPRKTVFLIIFLIILAVGIYFSFGLYWVIIAIILLVTGLLQYWIPTYYSLDEEGVKVKWLVLEKKKGWAEFKSYYEDRNGVFLSPFAKPTRLENYRGVYVRFPVNGGADEVMKFISKQIPKSPKFLNT